jgi:4,5-dihydroxyphthalate decarboxylase
MSRLSLTIAIGEYDHCHDLMSGRVQAEGIDLIPLNLPTEEIFYRFIKHREWDVSEMSMGKYVSMVSQGDNSLVAIPVFPSRQFRQSSLIVRTDGSVKTPQDIKGKRVGIPEWAQTASVYSRGWLVHQCGVALSDVEWVQAGVSMPGRGEKVALKVPEAVRYRQEPDKTLDGMLLSGEIDVVMSAHPPQSFKNGDPRVQRLFPDPLPVEEAFYRETKIYPIMHCIALRREVLDASPWVAGNLVKAFEEAKARSLFRMSEATASRTPIPFGHLLFERAKATFGADPFPFGMEANRITLDSFCQYAYEQGVAHRRVQIEELFPERLTASFKI